MSVSLPCALRADASAIAREHALLGPAVISVSLLLLYRWPRWTGRSRKVTCSSNGLSISRVLFLCGSISLWVSRLPPPRHRILLELGWWSSASVAEPLVVLLRLNLTSSPGSGTWRHPDAFNGHVAASHALPSRRGRGGWTSKPNRADFSSIRPLNGAKGLLKLLGFTFLQTPAVVMETSGPDPPLVVASPVPCDPCCDPHLLPVVSILDKGKAVMEAVPSSHVASASITIFRHPDPLLSGLNSPDEASPSPPIKIPIPLSHSPSPLHTSPPPPLLCDQRPSSFP